MSEMTRADLDRLSAKADLAMDRLNRSWFWYQARQSTRIYFAPVIAAWRLLMRVR